MKARKVILTLELLTDLPKKSFSKINLQEFFDGYQLSEIDSTLEVHQVSFQVVKEEK